MTLHKKFNSFPTCFFEDMLGYVLTPTKMAVFLYKPSPTRSHWISSWFFYFWLYGVEISLTNASLLHLPANQISAFIMLENLCQCLFLLFSYGTSQTVPAPLRSMLFVRQNDIIFPCASHRGAAFACVAVFAVLVGTLFPELVQQMPVKFECFCIRIKNVRSNETKMKEMLWKIVFWGCEPDGKQFVG